MLTVDDDPVWDQVVGQPEARARLTRAAAAPVHAYLFTGPEGVGTLRAARAFAALLLSAEADAAGDLRSSERIRRLALAGLHPDGIEFRPQGAAWRVDEANEIVGAAMRSPMEGRRKVIIVPEAHAIDLGAIGRLLKVIEEPPASTVFVLLAHEPPPEFVTIASRCVTIPFGPIPTLLVQQVLVDEGADAERAAIAAEAGGGDLDRARLLATDVELADRAARWAEVPARLDGRGATVFQLVAELREGMDRAQEPLDARHASELEALEERVEQLGERGSGRADLVARQKREVRRLRTDELRFGLATLARQYRDRMVVAGDPTAGEAIDAIQAVAAELVRNPNEALLLQALFCRLPPAS